jgi:ribonucleoside-triphosphate reductase
MKKFRKIIKRSGRKAKFSTSKITKALKQAGEVTGEFSNKIAEKLSIKVINLLQQIVEDRLPTVEDVQDCMEEVLLNSTYKETAKACVIYREQHKQLREITSEFNSGIIKDYLKKNDWKVNENSNQGFSLQGLNNYVSSEVTKTYWLNKIYPKEVRDVHNNGELHIHDLSYLSAYCFTGDTKVKLLNGEVLSFKKLSKKYKNKNFYVYSRDNTGKIVPGLAHSPRITQKNVSIIKIILDNNKEIKCTPNHRFMLRDGTYKEAQYLTKNDSLMPLHYFKAGGDGKQYEMITDLGNKKYTHRIIMEAILGRELFPGEVVHHKDGNKLNNLPENLELFTSVEHRAYEFRKTMKRDKWKKSNYNVLLKRNKSKKMRKIASKNAINNLNVYMKTDIGRALNSFGHAKNISVCKEEYLDFVRKNKYISVIEYNNTYNHKIKKITKLTTKEDVYDITVEEHHNFALESGVFVHNCVGWDLYDLLISGFSGVTIKAESKPAKHFGVCLGQLNNFFFTLAGEAAGAQAFSNVDTLLAPFIRYDKLSYREVKQALQEFVFNLNVPTRVGFQAPFSNITLDLNPSPNYAEQNVVIGGELQEEKYKDFQKEMDIFNKAFFEVMLEGDATGKVFTFPIPTYNITKDFNWDNQMLEGLWEMTSKYGIPYFSNFVNSDMKPEDARSMCCRLRLDKRQLEKRGGGLFGANPLTGSIGVVTINLPRIAYQSNNKKEFFDRLDRLMFFAKESLEIKRKMVESFTDENLYPYTKFYLRSVKERLGEYWKNHFSTIGLVGMNEVCLNFLKEDIGTQNGLKFAEETLDFMRNKLLDFQKETGNNYNLEATPAESTAYKLAKLDKEDFENIIVANEEDYKNGAEPYYTNSTQLPVGYSDSIVDVLDLQDSIQTKYTGGTVLHLFIGESKPSNESVKNLVKKICTNYHLPYFTITPTFSICQTHGYIFGEHFQCPKCNTECEVYSRVVGYLRPVSQWNVGKKAEFIDRKLFML